MEWKQREDGVKRGRGQEPKNVGHLRTLRKARKPPEGHGHAGLSIYTSDLQTHDAINVCCFKPLRL